MATRKRTTKAAAVVADPNAEVEVPIGPFTFKMTQGQFDALVGFANRANALMGRLIDPVEIVVRKRTEMPKYGPGPKDFSRGFWRSGPRRILLADDIFDPKKPLLDEKTLGHEVFHVIQDDHFTRFHRRRLLPFITPEADNWNDMTIGDEFKGYPALPYEAMACYGSAALFGWEKPAYSSLYLRKIEAADFDEVKAITLIVR